MTWLLLILYVSSTGHGPATLTTIRNFPNVATCETAATELQRRVPARVSEARGGIATACVPQPGGRRRG